jgi:hypothetical protein
LPRFAGLGPAVQLTIPGQALQPAKIWQLGQ